MSKSLLITLAIGVLMIASIGHAENSIIIDYIPFSVETYIAVTPDNIACKAQERWIISDKFQISQLNEILNQKVPAPFDSKRVRMKISGNHRIFYIDINGVASKEKVSTQINKEDITNFMKSLATNQRQPIKSSDLCE